MQILNKQLFLKQEQATGQQHNATRNLYFNNTKKNNFLSNGQQMAQQHMSGHSTGSQNQA